MKESVLKCHSEEGEDKNALMKTRWSRGKEKSNSFPTKSGAE